jgi:hypothetical protein
VFRRATIDFRRAVAFGLDSGASRRRVRRADSTIRQFADSTQSRSSDRDRIVFSARSTRRRLVYDVAIRPCGARAIGDRTIGGWSIPSTRDRSIGGGLFAQHGPTDARDATARSTAGARARPRDATARDDGARATARLGARRRRGVRRGVRRRRVARAARMGSRDGDRRGTATARATATTTARARTGR